MFQLDAAGESTIRAQPGFSGSPAVISDEWGDAVVGMLAIAPRDGAASDAYAIPLDVIGAAWPDVLGRRTVPPCPYRGLQTFSATDADAGLFVGREDEIDHLQRMVRQESLVMVVGPSGVGKSSLVEAGLIPALRADGWAVASFRPGAAPFDAVARALLEIERPGERHSLDELNDRATRLAQQGLWRVAGQLALLTGRRLALIGDQFEEILTLAGDQKQSATLLEQILPAPNSASAPDDVRLVCTLRADFLPVLLELPGMGQRLQDRQLNLSPLGLSALTRVIAEPAAVCGVTYAPRLASAIAQDASQGRGGLPLLEFTLTELWGAQREHRLSFDDYHEIGGVAGALNRHAERIYTGLTDRFGEARIRRVLLLMIRTRGGAASAVRTVVKRGALGGDWAIAEALAHPAHRLVVLGPDGPGTVEIAHEALIREWSRLATWVDEDAEFQRWLATMEERAAERDLLSDVRIGEAHRWLAERGADIPDEVANLITQSESAAQRRVAELREARKRAELLVDQLQMTTAQLEERSARLLSQQEEMRQSNAELEAQAEQLAVASKYRSEFLANMSHELRTPLNSLLILARLLADNSSGNLTDRQIEFAETIHRAGYDLLSLISDVLDLSKIEAGRMDVLVAPITANALVEYVDATFRPLTTAKGLDFHIRLDSRVPTELHTDEQRLQQILRNLLSNAVKFTALGSVELQVTVENDAVAFTVTDTGIGIAENKLSMVFGAFQQVDGTISRRHGGTGLGLSISRELAHLLGGHIDVSSALGRGSAFTLHLPLEPKIRGRGPSRARWPSAIATSPDHVLHFGRRFEGETVLVVDDDVRNVFALTSTLEQFGLTVRYAENGREALEMLERIERIDLILMDTMMPELDGYAATTEIRRIDRLVELPIIILSAEALPGDRERALQAGATEYMTLPADLDMLLGLIDTCLAAHES